MAIFKETQILRFFSGFVHSRDPHIALRRQRAPYNTLHPTLNFVSYMFKSFRFFLCCYQHYMPTPKNMTEALSHPQQLECMKTLPFTWQNHNKIITQNTATFCSLFTFLFTQFKANKINQGQEYSWPLQSVMHWLQSRQSSERERDVDNENTTL